jgi:glutamate-1-semialdehyde 2,1-aminomutase
LTRSPTASPSVAVLSARLRERALRCLPGGSTRTTLAIEPPAPYAASGRGCFVEDVDGRTLIDLQNNYTSLVHGHAHPAITEAAVSALRAGASFGLPTALEVELAEAITSRVPAVDQVRFANSGTEAVMMALRAARAFTGRDKVLRFAGSYHGSSDVVLPDSSPGLPAALASVALTAPADDPDSALALIESHAANLAAVLIDLMPNRAGLVPVDHEIAHALATRARDAGALVVVDEVITFRLAVEGLALGYGITPDLIVLGKTIGGGLPIGAFGGRRDVMQVFVGDPASRVAHGGTFTANPVTMAAGIAALANLDPEAIAHLNRLGDRLRAELRGLGFRVTGRGSLLRVWPNDSDHAGLWWRLYEQGVLIAGNGLACTSTPMTDAIVGDAVTRFAQAGASRA